MSTNNSALSDKKGTDGGIDRPDEPLIELPEVFIEKFDGDIEKARSARTTTPDAERPRCPDCGSFRVKRKIAADELPQRKDGAYRCDPCRNHFSEPVFYAGEEAENDEPDDQGEGSSDDQDDELDDSDRPDLEPGQSDFADFGGGV